MALQTKQNKASGWDYWQEVMTGNQPWHNLYNHWIIKENPQDYTNKEMLDFHNEVSKVKAEVQQDMPYKDSYDKIKTQRKVLRETEMRFMQKNKAIKRIERKTTDGKKTPNWTKDFAVISYKVEANSTDNEGKKKYNHFFPYEYLSKKWSQYIFWLDNPNHDYKLADFDDNLYTVTKQKQGI